MAKNWGLCKERKWWQIEPDATVTDQTVGECIDIDDDDMGCGFPVHIGGRLSIARLSRNFLACRYSEGTISRM
jgi:hypothetical protein